MPFWAKWLWRIGDEAEVMWRQLLIAKYAIARGGWDLKDPSLARSSFWKGIMSVKDNDMANINFRMGSGQKIYFWHSVWVGNTPLAMQFSNLFSCAKNREAKASEYMQKLGGRII